MKADPAPRVQRRPIQEEFALFIAFVGADPLRRRLDRVRNKLTNTPPAMRELYRERYFFQTQLELLGDQPGVFDTSSIPAIRAATLIEGINAIAEKLSEKGKQHFRSMILDNLDPDRDARQIEHEIRCYNHLGRLGHTVTFPDIDTKAAGKIYDMLVTTPSGVEYELECKTISGEIGMQIKTDLHVNLCKAFQQKVGRRIEGKTSGLLIIQILRPTSECKHLAKRFEEALASDDPLPVEHEFFHLSFVERPDWQAAVDAKRFLDLNQLITSEVNGEAYCTKKLDDRIFCACMKPHAESNVVEDLAEVLKKAAEQFSKQRPGIIWLHFVGMTQSSFMVATQNGGLEKAVELALIDRDKRPVRRHVQRVRFSADTDELSRNLVIAPNRMLVPAVSASGKTYEITNQFCIFPPVEGI